MDIKYKLIDVSHHNGDVDFAKVKADGIQGVIIRAGCGFSTLDKHFIQNITNALKLKGFHIGIYWFGYASSIAQAKQEAEFLAKTLDQYRGKIDLPIFYDWEYESFNYVKKQYGIVATKQLVSDMTQAFCETLEKYGWYSGFYANIDYLDRFYNQSVKDRFVCWVAQWSTKCSYSGQYSIWQYGAEVNKIDSKTMNGVESNVVDKNYLFKDLPSIIINGGYNGYSTTKQNIVYNYDVNGDGTINKSDLTALENYLKSIGEIQSTSTKSKSDVQTSNTTYPTWSGVKTFSYSKNKNLYVSPHFQVKEFASISNGKLYSDEVLISYNLVNKLEKLFKSLNCTSIRITSGYRTKQHDLNVGGNGLGQHTLGNACDIICKNSTGIISSKIISCVASEIGFNGIANITSNYQYTHVDVRPNSKWYGDETLGNSSIWKYNSKYTDFYTYYNISKDKIKNMIN